MADLNSIELDTVYTVESKGRRYFDGQFWNIEIQGGTVNIYATLRTDATTKAQMTAPDEAVSGFQSMLGVYKFWIETATGTPTISCGFKELLQ